MFPIDALTWSLGVSQLCDECGDFVYPNCFLNLATWHFPRRRIDLTVLGRAPRVAKCGLAWSTLRADGHQRAMSMWLRTGQPRQVSWAFGPAVATFMLAQLSLGCHHWRGCMPRWKEGRNEASKQTSRQPRMPPAKQPTSQPRNGATKQPDKMDWITR